MVLQIEIHEPARLHPTRKLWFHIPGNPNTQQQTYSLATEYFPRFLISEKLWTQYLNSRTRDQGRPTSRWKSFVGIRRLTPVEHLNPEMNFVSDHGSTPSANVKTLGELCDFCIFAEKIQMKKFRSLLSFLCSHVPGVTCNSSSSLAYVGLCSSHTVPKLNTQPVAPPNCTSTGKNT
jgi:hypothetical protein